MSLHSPSDLNWNHLFYFCVVGRHKSIRRAAEELQMSSSSLSEAVQGLERTMGCQLLVRNAKSVDMTAKGIALFNKVRTLYEHQSDIFNSIDLRNDALPLVTLGVIPSNTLPMLSKVILDILRFDRANKVRVKSADPESIEAQLLKGELDFALTNRRIQNRNVGCEKIYDCEAQLFVHRDLAAQNLSELVQSLRIGLLGDGSTNQQIQKHFENCFTEAEPRYLIADFLAILIDSALQKQAMIILSTGDDLSWAGDLVKKDVAPLASLGLKDELFIVWPKHIDGTQLHTFLASLLSNLRKPTVAAS